MNIGQVSKATGVSQRMIRHYEGIGLMPPPDRRDNGYRDYPPRSVERLRFIGHLGDAVKFRRQLGFGRGI